MARGYLPGFRIGERTKGTPLFQNGTGTRENGLVESRVGGISICGSVDYRIFYVGVTEQGIAQKFRTRRWALHAFPMRRATAVRNRPDKARRRLFRLGRDRVEFERCCLTRRRGGAEKHGENIFSGLASELARVRRKVKTWERGDSGDRTASQRGSRWGARLTKTARGGYRSWSGAFRSWQGEGRHGPKDLDR